MNDDLLLQDAACDDTDSYFDRSIRPVRIAIIGPESSGKSTLAASVALAAGGSLVLEAARSYLSDLHRSYVRQDLFSIACEQAAAEEEAALSGNALVVCDTDILTICIWSHEKFGGVDDGLLAMMRRTRYDRTFLCMPDIPWEEDPLRENPYDRDRLYEVYRAWLYRERRPYEVVQGGREDRLQHVLRSIGAEAGERE